MLISVVIPTHNRSIMLDRAINSVLTQTYENLEVIVVDDASTDDTENLVSSYQDSRVSYIKIKNSKGANFARNTGVRSSNGEYVAFLDDDDIWFPNKLFLQVEMLKNNSNLGLVYTGIEVVTEGEDIRYSIKPKFNGDISKIILTDNCIGTTSTVVLSRKVFEKAGGFDENLPQLQDYDLWIRIAQICEVGFISDDLIYYYVHQSISQLTSSADKNKSAIEYIDKKHAHLINDLPLKLQRKRFCQRYNAMGKRLMKSGNNSQARSLFIKSFRLSPNSNSVKFFIASFVKPSLVLKIKSKI
ncbi:glycosyltransferase family A protein [Vibrio sp. 1CM24A]|uniref:glycosyltransferase family 2 protein n=1 Tax=Vibrio sp. 1CM24A TaxID=2929165 RepID=UPI0020BD48D6|nr:glycosyltransferase family A protein [Vibrio sp. 1CM24A]MCK8083867.1 glycosyltransferase family 2 protein [Vibrio sp. 1CM24A]